MRVLFISDFSLVHCLGGAQQSNALIVKEGKKRNHIITELFHDSKFELTENNYDIVVSSNLEIFTAINKYQILNFLNTCNNHVRLEHDSNSYLIQNDRKKLLEEFRCVDKVYIFEEDDPYKLLQCVQPDIIVKGGDYLSENVIGSDLAEVVIFNTIDGYSTTQIIDKSSLREN